jgi:O-antigen/teichoic acid export membrane protein
VVDLIVVGLGVHFLAWGNKEYLLRAMSTDDGSMASLWQSSLLSRSLGVPLVILAMAVFGIDGDVLVWLAGWIVLAFLYQSFDVVVLYGHRFRLAIGAEILGLATTVGLLLVRGPDLDEGAVIAAWVIGVLIKTTALFIGLAPTLCRERLGRMEFRHIREALPFVLLGLSGLLHSRIDLYAMALLASPDDMGRYQVAIGLYIAFQAIAAFVLMPFVRELYEKPDDHSHAAAGRLAVGGIGIAVLSVPVAWLLLNGIYGFDFDWRVFTIGALMVAPVYRFAPRIYLLYKHHEERSVIAVNFAGAAVNLVLAVTLIPRWSIIGALGAAAISQWFILVCYEVVVRRRRRAA